MTALFDKCENCFINYRCPISNGKIPKPETLTCHHIDRIEKAMESSNIPAKYMYKTLNDFIIDWENAHCYEIIKKCIDGLGYEDSKEVFNLIITGREYGTGKTFSGCVILNEFIIKKYKLFDLENPIAMYVDFSSLMKRIKDNIDLKDPNLHTFIENVKTCPLLVIDDAGSTRLSDYVRDEAFVIFNERYANELSTILISNFSIDYLKDDSALTERIISRLSENGNILSFQGKDRRKTI